MGAKHSSLLSLDDIDDFCDLTYFSRKDIVRLFDRFCQVRPEAVKSDPLSIRLPAVEIFNAVQQLKYNPFEQRLIALFSSRKDECFSFDDFVDLASAFCEKSPTHVRASFAFRIFDFDDDGLLTETDLARLIDHLTSSNKGDNQSALPENELNDFVGYILDEAGLEGNRSINEMEFQQVIKKLPDFSTSFKFQL